MGEADRYERALHNLAEIDPGAAEQLMQSMREIAPDLARYALEFPFGDIFARPGLDLKTRTLVCNSLQLTSHKMTLNPRHATWITFCGWNRTISQLWI